MFGGGVWRGCRGWGPQRARRWTHLDVRIVTGEVVRAPGQDRGPGETLGSPRARATAEGPNSVGWVQRLASVGAFRPRRRDFSSGGVPNRASDPPGARSAPSGGRMGAGGPHCAGAPTRSPPKNTSAGGPTGRGVVPQGGRRCRERFRTVCFYGLEPPASVGVSVGASLSVVSVGPFPKAGLLLTPLAPHVPLPPNTPGTPGTSHTHPNLRPGNADCLPQPSPWISAGAQPAADRRQE